MTTQKVHLKYFTLKEHFCPFLEYIEQPSTIYSTKTCVCNNCCTQIKLGAYHCVQCANNRHVKCFDICIACANKLASTSEGSFSSKISKENEFKHLISNIFNTPLEVKTVLNRLCATGVTTVEELLIAFSLSDFCEELSVEQCCTLRETFKLSYENVTFDCIITKWFTLRDSFYILKYLRSVNIHSAFDLTIALFDFDFGIDHLTKKHLAILREKCTVEIDSKLKELITEAFDNFEDVRAIFYLCEDYEIYTVDDLRNIQQNPIFVKKISTEQIFKLQTALVEESKSTKI